MLSVFRTQKVGKLLFDLDTARCKATVTLFCDNGVGSAGSCRRAVASRAALGWFKPVSSLPCAGLVKSYTLTTMDAEILQATVDKQQFAVRITAETSAISRLLSSFDAGLEEVTVVALPDGSHRPVHINSFIDPLQGGSVVMLNAWVARWQPWCGCSPRLSWEVHLGFVGKSLYTSVQLDPTETFLAYVNSSGWILGWGMRWCVVCVGVGGGPRMGTHGTACCCFAALHQLHMRSPIARAACLLVCVDEATDVTINLKDLKAILSLCENLGTNMKLCFDSPGNPLVAEPHFPQIQAQVSCCAVEGSVVSSAGHMSTDVARCRLRSLRTVRRSSSCPPCWRAMETQSLAWTVAFHAMTLAVHLATCARQALAAPLDMVRRGYPHVGRRGYPHVGQGSLWGPAMAAVLLIPLGSC